MLSWKRDFSHTQAVREKMYEQFAATMSAGMDRMPGMVDRGRRAIAPDWVDLQLDADLLDGREGGPAGVVSIKRNAWTEGSGRSEFQTFDVDANPNGILPGTWTSTQTIASEKVESRPQ